MQLAVVVPVKDRERYVEILLRELPTYLERVNLIRDYTIYVAEQIGEDVFNLALSRNVGAAVALADGGYDYFVFQDVDVVPVTHVDYRFLGRGEAWFLTAGGCKLLASDLVRVNGYNPRFLGWGCEDVEFYHRLHALGCAHHEWHRSDEARNAVVVNLEWPSFSEAQSLEWSQGYFGHQRDRPRFISLESWLPGVTLERHPKSPDFMRDERQRRNERVWHEMWHLPAGEKLRYIAENGLNLVDLSKAAIARLSPRIVRITYRSDDVRRS